MATDANAERIHKKDDAIDNDCNDNYANNDNGNYDSNGKDNPCSCSFLTQSDFNRNRILSAIKIGRDAAGSHLWAVAPQSRSD